MIQYNKIDYKKVNIEHVFVELTWIFLSYFLEGHYALFQTRINNKIKRLVLSNVPGLLTKVNSKFFSPLLRNFFLQMMAEKLPLVMIDRPKMPRATWDALRNHIVSQRKRKKLELEQNAEVRFMCQKRQIL